MRLLTLITLMILGALAVRTQEPNPYMSHGVFNGLLWRDISREEKLYYVLGASEGYITGARTRDCNAVAPLPSWFHVDVTSRAVVNEMDSFFEDGANISMPILLVYQYSEMKLGGASKQELDHYLTIARQAAIR